MHNGKGHFRVLLELLDFSLTGSALAEIAHIASAMNLFPGETRFPSYESLASFGFQQLLAFAMYLPFILLVYARA